MEDSLLPAFFFIAATIFWLTFSLRSWKVVRGAVRMRWFGNVEVGGC